MTILDTSVVVDLVRARAAIRDDITAITLIEYPRVVFINTFMAGSSFRCARTS